MASQILRQLALLNIDEITTLYKNGTITPTDVITHQLHQLDAVEKSDINPIAYRLPRDSILQQARQSTLRYKNECALGVFDGIPITIKDVTGTSVKGLKVRTGILNPKYHQIPQSTTPCVQALLNQGAIILCQTTCPSTSQKTVTSSLLYGTTKNPHNRELITGGSSGGAGALAALGIGCINIGSDAGGSVRIPSSICGVIGLRVTLGTGRYAPFPHWVTTGPLARNVRDIELYLEAMPRMNLNYNMLRGYEAGVGDVGDIGNGNISTSGGRDRLDARRFRIAVSKTLDGSVNYVDEIIWDSVVSQMEAIRLKYETKYGMCIGFVDPAIYNSINRKYGHYMDCWNKLKKACFYNDYKDFMIDNEQLLNENKIDGNIMEMYNCGKNKITQSGVIQCLSNRCKFQEIVWNFFDKYDLLITPTVPILTPNNGGDNKDIYKTDGFLKDKIDGKRKLWTDCYHSNAAYTTLSTITLVPGLSMPLKYDLRLNEDSGGKTTMPIGIQIMSGMHKERKILQFAKLLEKEVQIRVAKL